MADSTGNAFEDRGVAVADGTGGRPGEADWRRVRALFEEAREWPREARDARLRDACTGDEALYAEVIELLAADGGDGLLDSLRVRLPSVGAVLSEPRPERVGAYRLVRELGSGGMGVVYLGERDDGQFRQRAAIKLIRTTDAGDPLHRRFLAERRILAGLHHPNIARLLDGGITEDGRPYLVMEYIDGVPITEYCDAHRLDVPARLRLFCDVCDAVQHAHRNLVIHRDLKPANILVSGDGRVHLLDFGIAKLLEPDGQAHHATRIDRAMTPGYASPEQVLGEALTTASDVYSLGTLLYELLTGCRPFDLCAASTAELLDAIRGRDPARPSERATDASAAAGEPADTPAARAAARATTPERLRRELSGDLDAIVHMALRKEPQLRYGSVGLLREDLERWLGGLPVMAHRGSRRYRFGKLVRRHRMEFAAVAVAVVSLVAGLAAAVGQARRAGLERDRAEHARSQAELALAEAREISDFLMELFSTAASSEPADALTALDLLRRGSERADSLAGQPVVQARLLDVVGQLWTRLGRYDEARGTLDRAVAIRLTHPGPDSTDLATSLIHLSHVHRALAEETAAQDLVRRALGIRRAALSPDHPDLAEALYEMGWLTYGVEQERYYREALEVLRRSGTLPEQQQDVMHGIATNLRRRGLYAEAIAMDREALAFAASAFGPEHPSTGYAMIHLGDHVLDLEHDVAEAERLYRQGLALMQNQPGGNDVRLAHGIHSLGRLLSEKGDWAEAEAIFRHILELRVAATGPEHPRVAESQRMLAEHLMRAGRLAEAGTLAQEALALARRLQGADHPSIPLQYMALLARIAERQNRFERADSIYREAIAMRDGVDLVRDYGRFLIRRREYVRAEPQLLALLALQRRFDPAERHPSTIETHRVLRELYIAWGKPAEAERHSVPEGRFVAY